MTWVAGALINLCGSVLINLGTNVMKLGHNKRAACCTDVKPPIRTFREWQLGIALFAVGNILNFVSLGFAAQSLLAALGSIQFVSNVVFAWFVLKERATGKVLAATACIVGGCLLLVIFGNHTSDTLTVAHMLQYYNSAGYIVYLVFISMFAAAMFLTYRRGKLKQAQEGREALSGPWMRLLPVSYALYAGMLGTQSVVFCKSLSTLLRTTIAGDSQLGSFFFWGLMAAFLATAAFWVNRLNQGLKEFPSIVIVPMMQISWTLFSIVSGGIYFQEYSTFTALSGFMFTLGVLVVCAGVYLLTPSKRAYLRYYKDLEDDIMGHHRGHSHPDIESMMSTHADKKFAAAQLNTGKAGEEAEEGASLLANSDAHHWSKAISRTTSELRPRHTEHAEVGGELLPVLPSAHVTLLATLPIPGLKGVAADDSSSTSSRISALSVHNAHPSRSVSSGDEGSGTASPSAAALELVSIPLVVGSGSNSSGIRQPGEPVPSREQDFAMLFPSSRAFRRSTQ